MATAIPFIDRDLIAIMHEMQVKRIAPVVQEAGMIDYVGGILGQFMFARATKDGLPETIRLWEFYDHCAGFGGFGLIHDISEHCGVHTLQMVQPRGDMDTPWRLSIQVTVVDGDENGYIISAESLIKALEHHVETLWLDAQWTLHAAIYQGTEHHTKQQRLMWQNRAPVVIAGKRYGPSEGFNFGIALAREAVELQRKMRLSETQ